MQGRGGAPHADSKELYASAIGLDEALFWFADYAAGDARRGSGGSSSGDRMNHDCGSAVAENGMIVRAHRDVGRNDRCVAGSISSDNQRKIGDISGRQTRVLSMAGSAVEVWPSGLEVGRLALGGLMDVQGMLARRQTLYIQLDLYAMGGFAEHGGADTLALRVLDFNGDRFSRSSAPGVRNRNAGGENYRAHNGGNRFHRSSFQFALN